MPDDASRPPENSPLTYSEVIESGDVRVPFLPEIVTPNIERPLRSGRYEGGERRWLKRLLRPDDRLLDLGAGLGVVSAAAADVLTHGRILSVEAHPDLLPLVEETWQLNDVRNADLRHGLISAAVGPSAPFYKRADFWASSFEANSRPYVAETTVQRIAIDELISEFAPTVISCDIEGGEAELFDRADLSGVRAIVIELHPKVYGEATASRILSTLRSKGLFPEPQAKPSTVHVLRRRLPDIAWPPADPRILVATCMKDEGPFILEWLAWHKAVGVTDFVVFTNDCTDGTDALLDRLDDMGLVTHLPNPASVSDSTYFQPLALRYVESLPVYRRSDFFLSMDVDEFINVKVGDGRLTDLLAALPAFDVLSMNELNHGSNDILSYRRGWVTEQFPRHASTRPGRYRCRMGVKSLVRISDRVARVRNHRPDLSVDVDEAVWLDGSGRPTSALASEADRNWLDCRGAYDLVTVEHFPLRSLDSFLVKMFRGDVVVKGKQVSERYWRVRNRNDHLDHDLVPGIARAREVYRRFEEDTELMRLHDASCTAHEARIAALLEQSDYRERRERIVSGE